MASDLAPACGADRELRLHHCVAALGTQRYHRATTARHVTMTDSSSKLTREDALVYLRRFPAQGVASVALNIAMVLAGNAIVFFLLHSGQLRAAHLIALVVVETVALIAISAFVQRLAPRHDWLEQPKPWREKGPLFAFALVWLGGAYGIALAMLHGYGDLFALAQVSTWIDTGLYLPLLYTVAFALVHAIGDWQHYRRDGGPFQSSVSQDAMGRYLTLLLGGIPFAMPFFAVVIGGVKGIEYVTRRARAAPLQSVLVGAAMIGIAYAGFALVGLLISSQVTGWAIGFVFAKLIAEIMMACVPLVMAHVAKNGP